MMEQMEKKDLLSGGRLPSVWLSMVPIAVLVALLFFAVGTFGTDTLSGASQLSLVFSGGVAAAIGMGVYRLSWPTIERAVV